MEERSDQLILDACEHVQAMDAFENMRNASRTFAPVQIDRCTDFDPVALPRPVPPPCHVPATREDHGWTKAYNGVHQNKTNNRSMGAFHEVTSVHGNQPIIN